MRSTRFGENARRRNYRRRNVCAFRLPLASAIQTAIWRRLPGLVLRSGWRWRAHPPLSRNKQLERGRSPPHGDRGRRSHSGAPRVQRG